MMGFDEDNYRTSEKMADLVMEYASQFIARGHLDAYEKAIDEKDGDYVPFSFDDKVYKSASKQIRRKLGLSFRLLRICVCAILILIASFTYYIVFML